MVDDEKYILKFSHKIIEHLGIKLYQNRPTNVIAELVSNSWDADAENTWINISVEGEKRLIVVMDDGCGMSPETIRKSYLVIGRPKRHKDTPDETSTNGRYLMGRKGIGKLAPFGIAGHVHLVSIVVKDGKQSATWLLLDLERMRELEDADEETSIYEPTIYCSEAPITKLREVAEQSDKKKRVDEFLQKIDSGSGTMIFMSNLSTQKAIDPSAIKESIGRRFTVTLLRPDFKVFVNDSLVTEEDALPDFAFQIGQPATPINDSIPFNGKQLELKYWAGFVGYAQWPQDQAGVGVYTHGKVAQDRPFTFGIKGSEIFTRYMYAVVEADWLDELPEDLVSTDRTTVDWEHPETKVLKEWGETKVREWVSQYQKFRKTEDKRVNIERVRHAKEYKFTEAETEAIAELLAEISPTLGNDESAQAKAVDSISGAWIHAPMREMTKKLWDGLKTDYSDAKSFIATIDRLRDYLVPESLSLAVTFSQRVYALSLLHRRIHFGTETDLQKLLETFPWILNPEMEKLTANQQLKTVIEEAEQKGEFTVNKIESSPADTLKPDFVFFSPPGEYNEIVVVELKNPGSEHHLTKQNELQLTTYMLYIETRYPKAKLSGFLIGNNTSDLASKRSDLRILDWSEVLERSRKGHIELLASMLIGANPDPNDSRVAQVAQYGGKETVELLERLAENDPDLKGIILKFGKLP